MTQSIYGAETKVYGAETPHSIEYIIEEKII